MTFKMRIFSIEVSLTLGGGGVFLCSLFLAPLLQQFEIKYVFFLLLCQFGS